MTNAGIWIVPAIGGAALAGLYLLLLWLTVRRLPQATRPAIWLLGSAVLRIVVVAAGLFGLMAGDWRRLLVALAAFVAVRALVTAIVRPRPATLSVRP